MDKKRICIGCKKEITGKNCVQFAPVKKDEQAEIIEVEIVAFAHVDCWKKAQEQRGD